MGVCKNTSCENKTKNNKVYCSLKCRNIFVNKNIRDYNKNGEGISKKFKEEYNKDPKYCLECGNQIPYKKKRNKFCNRSCSAKYNNSRRTYTKEHKNNISEALKYEKIDVECEYCGNIFKVLESENRKFCSIKCSSKSKEKSIDESGKLISYRHKCKFKFNVYDYPEEFNLKLLEKYGWYKAVNNGNNLNGVSRDHKYSVKKGFKNKVDSEIISHPANCQLLLHNKNISKGNNCSISLDNLKEEIKSWNNKYN